MKKIKFIATFIISCFIICLLLEIYMSGTQILQPNIQIPNPKVGLIYMADNHIIVFNEGFGITYINQHGYFGRDCSSYKPNNEIRIALIGDSYVAGLQVLERQHFASILEKKLNHKNDMTNYKVLNFGVEGYNLSDMYCQYQNLAKEFNLDLALFFVSEEDMQTRSENIKKSKAMAYVDIQNDSLVIKYDYIKSLKIIYDPNFINPEILGFILNFSYIRLLDRIIHMSHIDLTMPILFDKFFYLFEESPNSSSQPKTAITEIPLISKLIMSKIKQENGIIVYRDTITSKTDSIIKQIGIQSINLNDTLNILKEKGIDPNYWELTKQRGHWNQIGHEAVGKYLANKINQYK